MPREAFRFQQTHIPLAQQNAEDCYRLTQSRRHCAPLSDTSINMGRIPAHLFVQNQPIRMLGLPDQEGAPIMGAFFAASTGCINFA
jgi:hypothetical protein